MLVLDSVRIIIVPQCITERPCIWCDSRVYLRRSTAEALVKLRGLQPGDLTFGTCPYDSSVVFFDASWKSKADYICWLIALDELDEQLVGPDAESDCLNWDQ